jgi:hypothetical protein
VGLPRASAWFYLGLLLLILVVYPGVWPGAPYTNSDSAGYLEVAEDMADFHLDQLHFRSPGYPLLLLLTGSTEAPTRALFFVSLGLHFISLWVLATVLYRLSFAPWSLNLFGFMASLPPFMEPTARVLTENLTEFLLVLSFAAVFFWLYRRSTRYVVAVGFLLALAALVRPPFQLAGLAIALCLIALSVLARAYVRRGEATWAGLVIFLVSSLSIASFAGYNYAKHSFFGISPGTLGYSLTSKTVRVLERLPDEYAIEREILIAVRDSQLVARGSSHTAYQYWDDAKPKLARVTGKSDRELDSLILRINFLLIRKAPLNYLSDVLQSLPSYWFPAMGTLSTGNVSLLLLFWAGLHFIWVGFFMLQMVLLVGLSLLALSRRFLARHSGLPVRGPGVDMQDVASYLLALSLVVYTMLISCGVAYGEPRYRVPTDLLILFLSFLGARIWWRLARSDREPGATESVAL